MMIVSCAVSPFQKMMTLKSTHALSPVATVMILSCAASLAAEKNLVIAYSIRLKFRG
jgi:hypothetical protein